METQPLPTIQEVFTWMRKLYDESYAGLTRLERGEQHMYGTMVTTPSDKKFIVRMFAPLHHGLQAVGFQEFLHGAAAEVEKRRFYEVGVAPYVEAEFVPVLYVAEVAPAFAGNHNLSARARHLLQDGHRGRRTGLDKSVGRRVPGHQA